METRAEKLAKLEKKLAHTRHIEWLNEQARLNREKKYGRPMTSVVPDYTNILNQIAILKEPENRQERYDMVLKLETIKEEKKMSTSFKSKVFTVPYFTDDLVGMTLGFEPYEINPFRETAVIPMNQLIRSYLTKLLKNQPDYQAGEIEQIDPRRIFIVLKNPFAITETQTALIFSSQELYNADNDTVTYVIEDYVLYSIIISTIKGAFTFEKTDYKFSLAQIDEINKNVNVSNVDDHFKQLAKIMYIASLTENGLDDMGMVDVAMSTFSVGTYSQDLMASDDVYTVTNNDTMLYNFRNWQGIFQASVNIIFNSGEVTYVDVPESIIHNYIPVTNVGFRKCNHTVAQTIEIPFTMIDAKQDMSIRSMYNQNIEMRNNMLSRLDDKDLREYVRRRDAMFPKTGYGAVGKLRSILSTIGYDLQHTKSVFEFGVAPGTWAKYILDNAKNIEYYHGITPLPTKVHLKMDENVLSALRTRPNFKIIYEDALTYDLSSNYDLILSDAATNIKHYAQQAYKHNDLFSSILSKSLCHLNPGGTLIMKIFDLTEVLHNQFNIVANQFQTVNIIKPNESKYLNSEQYIVFRNYRAKPEGNVFELEANANICTQILTIKHFLQQAYGIRIFKHPFSNKRQFCFNAKNVPARIYVPLSRCNTNSPLFDNVSSGTIIMCVADNGDENLIIDWDVNALPLINTFYPVETHIKYKSAHIPISIPYTTTKSHYTYDYAKPADTYTHIHQESSFILHEVSPSISTVIVGNVCPSVIPSCSKFISAEMIANHYKVQNVQQFLMNYNMSDYLRGLTFFRIQQSKIFFRNYARATSTIKPPKNSSKLEQLNCQDRNSITKLMQFIEVREQRGLSQYKIYTEIMHKYALSNIFNSTTSIPILSFTSTYREYATNKELSSRSICHQYRFFTKKFISPRIKSTNDGRSWRRFNKV